MNKKKLSKTRKSIIAALCAVAVTCTGLAAACAPTEDDTTSTSTPQKEDNQLLKNGNFEYFTVPEDAVHLIRSVQDWSRSGDSSGTMSGIINTSDEAWKLMSSEDLKSKLDANNDLDSSDSDYEDLYVDYNGMDSADILYKEPYAASLDSDAISDDEDIISKRFTSYQDFIGVTENNGEYYFGETRVYKNVDDNDFYFDEAFTSSVRYAVINNPETHLGSYKTEGDKHYLGDTQIYLDDDGNYYLDEDKEESVGNVLMIHNYPNNKLYNGIEQHYSSTTVSLEANTAAEISLWVKTSDLKFDKGASQLNDQDRGAYIEVVQTVGSTTIDSFFIKAINTEKILNDNKNLSSDVASNGWLKYTIYVNACDFADSTIQLNLGLGDTSTENKVTGYAFFDDVEVKKYIDFSDEDSTYGDHKNSVKDTTVTLTNEEDERIFYADREVRKSAGKTLSDRNSTDFYYFIDLTSTTNPDDKTHVALADSKVKNVMLTTDKSGEKLYATAELANGKSGAKVKDGMTENYDELNGKLPVLPNNWNDGKDTSNDLIGIFDADATFSADDFNPGANKYWGLLNDALTGDNGIRKSLTTFVGEDGVKDMLVMLSAYGAAYTATIQNDNFTVAKDSYKIVSFWIKTSDMDGLTGATVKIVDTDDKDVYASFTIDTTGIETTVGDHKNIYNDWVQCFFFVHNDGDEEQEFKLEVSFGNTSVASSSYNNFAKGWLALANMQVLDNLTEEVFDLVTESDYAKILTLGADEDDIHNSPFDEAKGTSDVRKGVANPSDYTGVNGGSISVTDKEYEANFDRHNYNRDNTYDEETNRVTSFVNNAGLINRDYFTKDYGNYEKILEAFGGDSQIEALENWNNIFGKDCYQPLIILNTLRDYYDKAVATETTFNNGSYYIKDGDRFREVNEDDKWDEDETYYSKQQVLNYGFIGSNQTASSDSYLTVSVKVMVSNGATAAYVYLVDTTSREVMGYDIPEYTFYYDEDGNVLSKEYDEDWTETEHRNAIVYTLRDDGLYDSAVDGDTNVYANIYNLTKDYKYAKFEHNEYYDGNGKKVSFDDLVKGETYYDENGNLANHYLVVNEQRVYEYVDGDYYYLVEGARDTIVKGFDTQYARYTPAKDAPLYAVEVAPTDGKWITVNFVIHTGNADKNYRVELWSGKRDETGKTTPAVGGVAFDYSSFSITESNYDTVLSEYENNIISAYKKLLRDNGKLGELTSNTANIAELETLIKELGLSDSVQKYLEDAGCSKYFAQYYTYTFYDSADFVPFNTNTAGEGELGYDYSIGDYSETLAYLSYKGTDGSYNTFIDYSAVDQTIDMNTVDDGDDSEDDENENDGSGWLLITSIILTVVILFALIAVAVRELWKRNRAKNARKIQETNNYKKRERYIRKLGLVRATDVEEEAPEAEETEPVEEPAPAEEPAEETPAEPVEEPAEEVTETPAAEEPASDEDKKDE